MALFMHWSSDEGEVDVEKMDWWSKCDILSCRAEGNQVAAHLSKRLSSISREKAGKRKMKQEAANIAVSLYKSDTCQLLPFLCPFTILNVPDEERGKCYC